MSKRNRRNKRNTERLNNVTESTTKRDPVFLWPIKRDVAIQPLAKLSVRSKKAPVFASPLIQIELIRDIMCSPWQAFADIPGARVIETPDNQGRKIIYINRGAPVLGVAHLDSVKVCSSFWSNKDILACPTLDDRIGAWALMHGLPSLGIDCDILLTDGEESHATTGKYFEPEKKYNWMFMFDRTGDDAACYDYLDYGWRTTLEKYAMKPQYGGWSCIADMQHLGCKALNVGNGMMDYHSDSAYLKLSVLRAQLVKFSMFAKENWETHFPHTKTVKVFPTPVRQYSGTTNWGTDGAEEFETRELADQIAMVARDRAKVTKVWDVFYTDLLLPDEWYKANRNPVSGKGHKSKCVCCKHFFSGVDTMYSSTYPGNLCLRCFVYTCLLYGVYTMEEYWRMHEAVETHIEQFLETLEDRQL